VVERFGYRPVRGSSSRGAVGALLEMHREVEQGRAVAITVDGPRGPRFVTKTGPITLAANTSAPIRPLHFAVSSAWHLEGWDGFRIPKPLARVLLVMDGPLRPATGDTEMARGRLQAALERVRDHAEQHVRD